MMKHSSFFSINSMVFAILILLSVSVCPAMALQAESEKFNNCPSCIGGTGDLSTLPGFENHSVPTINIREISREVTPKAAVGGASSGNPSVGGIRTMNTRLGTIAIQDPRAKNSAGLGSAFTAKTDNGYPKTIDSRASVIVANMSKDGYDLTGTSYHRYETLLKSEDFLSLNNSQRSALTVMGFTLTSEDTIRSYRDVAFYTFTNRSTGSLVYLMAVQKLGPSATAVGATEYAMSPDFSPDGKPIGASTGTSQENGGYCFWEWTVVALLTAGLIMNIVILLGVTSGAYAEYILQVIGLLVGTITTGNLHHDYWGGRHWEIWGQEARTAIVTIAIVTGLLLLIALAYAVYDLGICKEWWDPVGEDDIVWTYAVKVDESAAGMVQPLNLHDQFALTLFADTRADPNAEWIVQSHPGLEIRDKMISRTENGTVQSWLIETTIAGSQDLVLVYVTSNPIPPTVAGPVYTLHVSTEPGHWKISTVDKTAADSAEWARPSLVIDPTGNPRLGYYNAMEKRIIYAELIDGTWKTEPVAESAGTYTVSLALDPHGNPAMSFGDGVHFGNLMYAIRNDSRWNVTTVDKGTMGDAGQYSSLAFDNRGKPAITYNDGQYSANLMYASQDDSDWVTECIDSYNWNKGLGSSLRFDADGHPHVAYTGGSTFASLMYMHNIGKGWTGSPDWGKKPAIVDDGGTSLTSTGFDPSLALDSQGTLHITYYNRDNGDLMHTWWKKDSKKWSRKTIASANDVGRFSSLAIDNADNLHVSYYDASYKILRYAVFQQNPKRWVFRTIDNDGDVGAYSSLALDSAGHPSIAYYDRTNHVLKFAGWTE